MEATNIKLTRLLLSRQLKLESWIRDVLFEHKYKRKASIVQPSYHLLQRDGEEPELRVRNS